MKILKIKHLVLIGMVSCAAVFAGDARFSNLKGTVQIYQNGKWVDASLKTTLPSGSIIQTGLRSSVVVIYPKGGQLALAQNTKATIFDQTLAQGTNREVMVDHGHISAFVKKSETGARNEFRMRTPTVVAGVRGSLIAAMLVGQTLTVSAVQSAAQIARATESQRSRAAEFQLANARKSVATAQDFLKRAQNYLAELKAELAAAQASGSPSANRIAQLAQLTENNIKTYTADVARYSAMEKDFAAKASTAKGNLVAIAEEERMLIKIAQGDSAQAVVAGISGPVIVQNKTTRPSQSTTIGQTGTEKSFVSKTDVKVGIGNDFQKVFNTVNTVTQPTTTGAPTLKKL